ncbi:MAG: ATP synthase F1 subunit epsilon [Candidatus Sericytochromatia bacterium]|nr:ATP synthase F1 subunit epsilon [Candidatus Tanganyikabacteria bacterium]
MPLTLDVITPERTVLSEEVDFVSARALEGELGVLPGHAPLFTSLRSDVVVARKGADEMVLAVMGGFLEVAPGRVTVLTPAAERAEDIDKLRAEEARKRAELEIDRTRTTEGEAALARALIRLRAVEVLGGRRLKLRPQA